MWNHFQTTKFLESHLQDGFIFEFVSFANIYKFKFHIQEYFSIAYKRFIITNEETSDQ